MIITYYSRPSKELGFKIVAGIREIEKKEESNKKRDYAPYNSALRVVNRVTGFAIVTNVCIFYLYVFFWFVVLIVASFFSKNIYKLGS